MAAFLSLIDEDMPLVDAGSNTSRVAFYYDFRYLPGGGYTFPLAGLYTRAGLATAQVSSAVVIDSIAANVAPIGRDNDTDPMGLIMEPTRTNQVLENHRMGLNAPWTPTNATATSNQAISPDGTNNASRIQFAGVGGTLYQAATYANGSYYQLSSWLQQRTASGAVRLTQQTSAGLTPSSDIPTTAAWARTTYASGQETANIASFVGYAQNVGNTAVDFYAWAPQLEVGKYPTETIITGGLAVTRSNAKLVASMHSAVNSAGNCSAWFNFKAKCSDADGDTAMRFITTGLHYVEISNDGLGTVTVHVNGVNNTAAGVHWSRGDEVNFFVSYGAGTTKIAYSVNGGAVIYPTIVGVALASMATVGLAQIYCSAISTQQLAGWHRFVIFYEPGNKPAWVI